MILICDRLTFDYGSLNRQNIHQLLFICYMFYNLIFAPHIYTKQFPLLLIRRWAVLSGLESRPFHFWSFLVQHLSALSAPRFTVFPRCTKTKCTSARVGTHLLEKAEGTFLHSIIKAVKIRHHCRTSRFCVDLLWIRWYHV